MHLVCAAILLSLSLALQGCAIQPSESTARRKAFWAGTHQLHLAYEQHGGQNEVKVELIISDGTPPVFLRWSEAETRVTPTSITRNIAAIPGEVAAYRTSDLSGGNESLQRHSRQTLVKAEFSRDYTTLTLHYRNSDFDGVLKRAFRLDESSELPRVLGDDATIYTKLATAEHQPRLE